MPWDVKRNGNMWCVYKKGSSTPIKGGCHPTEVAARKQQKALYANYTASEGGAKQVSSYLAFAENATVGDDGLLWVEALPAKTWYDPRWGDIPIDEAKLNNFVRNFNENTRGQEVTTDYEHGLDPAKGKRASGTYRKFEIRPRNDGAVSLWAGIEPTPTALGEIKNKEWKYFSLEWEDEWVHPETKQTHQDVIVGGALTNRPIAKGMMPINFSEVFIERLDVKPEHVGEHAPEEHQEPGTGAIDPSINEDDSGREGWRRDTPPPGEDPPDGGRSDTVSNPNEGSPALNQNEDEGGEFELTPEELEELRNITGIDEHGDVVAAVKAMSEELVPLRELEKQTNANKKFAEEYPEEAERLAELEKTNQENFAKQFSESFESRRVVKKTGEGDELKTENTTIGFSALVLDEIQKCAKAFSEGKPTFDEFKGVLDAIFDNGIVDYGNKGSERHAEEEEEVTVIPGTKSARKAFADKVTEIQNEDEKFSDYSVALVEAGKRHPKLAEAWRESNVVAA